MNLDEIFPYFNDMDCQLIFLIFSSEYEIAGIPQ